MRKTVKIHVLGNSYREILDAINSGFIYVGKNQDEVVLINKKGQNREYKVIVYNPLIYVGFRFEVNIDELKKLSKELSKTMEEQYKIEDNEYDMIEQFGSISDALIALQKGSYKNYTAIRL